MVANIWGSTTTNREPLCILKINLVFMRVQRVYIWVVLVGLNGICQEMGG